MSRFLAEVGNRYDEELFEGVHASGLRLRVLRKRGFSRVSAAVGVDLGALDRELALATGRIDLPHGLAHFLEHQMFESEQGDVAARFAALGADSNAYTSYAATTYVCDTSDQPGAAIRLLLDLVATPRFTRESVAKEQRVIAEEIRMYEGEPGARQYQDLLGGLYARHPIRDPIAGTIESIAAIDAALLRDVHAVAYTPRSLALAVVGDIDPAAIEAIVHDAFGNMTRAAARPPATKAEADDAAPVARESRRRMDVTRPRWLIGIKDRAVPATATARLVREMEAGVLLDALFSPSSGFHERALEDGLIDDTFGCEYHLEHGAAFASFASDLDGASIEATASPPLEEAIFAALAGAAREGIRDEDFERVRAKQHGRFVGFLDVIDALAPALALGALDGLAPFAWFDALARLEPAALQARAAALADRGFATRAILLPAE
jgi:predicted Zn-dependent peptidase